MRQSENPELTGSASHPALHLDLTPAVRLEPWALCFAGSIVLVTLFPAIVPFLLSAGMVPFTAAIWKTGIVPPEWRLMVLLVPVFVSGGVVVALLHANAPDPLAELAAMEPGEVEIVGTMASPPVESGFGSRADLRIEKLSFDGKEVLRGGTVEVYAPGLDGVGVGDGLRVVGEISIPDSDGEFDYARYLATRRISAVVEGVGVYPVDGKRGWVGTVHRRTDIALGYGLRPTEAAVVRGMTLGDRSLIPEELDAAFQDSGITHVLAISGQHVAVLTAAMYFVLRLMSVPLGARVGVTLVASWVYIVVAGAPPSAIRAGVVATLVMLAVLLGRQASPLHFMSTMLAFVLAYNPMLVYNPGFQLSVAAVFGILLLRKPISTLLPKGRGDGVKGVKSAVASLLSISLAAQIATAPIIAASFEQVSLVGVFTNLVAVPVSGPVLGLGLSAALLGNIAPALAFPVNAANGFLVSILELVARSAAAMPFATVTTPGVSLPMVAVFYLGCVPAGLSRWVFPEQRWPFWAGVMLVWTGAWISLVHLAAA